MLRKDQSSGDKLIAEMAQGVSVEARERNLDRLVRSRNLERLLAYVLAIATAIITIIYKWPH